MNQLLFAAIDDNIIKIVVAFVVLLIGLINHLVKAQKPAPKPPPARVPPEPVVGPARAQQDDEVEEFLRRAAEARRRAQRGSPQQPVAAGRPKAKPKAKPPKPRVPAPVVATVVQRGPRESVAEHVERQISSEEFNVRAAHMVDDLARADTERQRHFTQTFDHQLGRLSADVQTTDAAAPASTALAAGAQAAATFGTLEDIRRAILLNEILNRPRERF
jgi:hypothetical protein